MIRQSTELSLRVKGHSRRKPVKQQQILRTLRQQIVTGQLGPGDRLPTRAEMEAVFGCSSVTIQRAIDRLLRDGFIVAKGRLGTFVTDRPPNLCHYALAFTDSSEVPGRGSLAMTLHAEAARIGAERAISFHLFEGIDGQTNSRSYQALQEAVAQRRLAGILFLGWRPELAWSPVIAAPEIPCLAVTGKACPSGVRPIRLDTESFLRLAVEHAAGRGRRRIAFLLPAETGWRVETVRHLAAAGGMSCREAWVQAQMTSLARWARHQVQLLLDAPAERRPDTLAVADDGFLPVAMEAAHEAGLRVPDDLLIVAHGNFPLPVTTPGVARLGYDCREILLQAIAAINDRKDGLTTDEPLVIAPAFAVATTAGRQS